MLLVGCAAAVLVFGVSLPRSLMPNDAAYALQPAFFYSNYSFCSPYLNPLSLRLFSATLVPQHVLVYQHPTRDLGASE
jgi:hypothetical protein